MRNLTRSVVYRLQVVGQRGAWVALTAAQDRMSLRKTVLIHTPQPPPPTNWLCQYADYGLASDIRSRAAGNQT